MPKFVKFSFYFLSFLLLSLVFASTSTAADCGPAQITPSSGGQNWDATYCVLSSSRSEIESITSVSATCREAPPGGLFVDPASRQNCSCYYQENMNPVTRVDLYSVCNSADLNLFTPPAPPATSTMSVTPAINQDASGNYYTCFTLASLSRDMGKIDVYFNDSSGNLVCQPPIQEVAPGNYSWIEYYDNTLETRFNVDIIQNPNEMQQAGTSAICTDITGTLKINTALGCIDVSDGGIGFIRSLVTIGVGLGGAIALLLMLYGFFTLTTSAGIPEKVKAGKEIITSAVAGLVFVLLSVVMMNLIGVQILAIPGL